MSGRLTMLVVSHVVPGSRSGQMQRVSSILKALSRHFCTTVLLGGSREQTEQDLMRLRNDHREIEWLFPKLKRGLRSRLVDGIYSSVLCCATGLRRSNYTIPHVLFSEEVLRRCVGHRRFDCVLFEYWHAHERTQFFRKQGIPCVLDMNDILWRAYDAHLRQTGWMPNWLREIRVGQYRSREEAAWRCYDAVVAINSAEWRYVQGVVQSGLRVDLCPMGLDGREWAPSWDPAVPPRVAFYGGLGSDRNRKAALDCYRKIMPLVWLQAPNAEFWLIGSSPGKALLDLKQDTKVKVTGYLPNVQETLRKVSVILCPWEGTFGFRTRIVEAMSLGVPVVAQPSAVDGMGLDDGEGVLLAETPEEMAAVTLRLLRNRVFATEQSHRALRKVEDLFSFDATYGKWALELREWLAQRSAVIGENRNG